MNSLVTRFLAIAALSCATSSRQSSDGVSAHKGMNSLVECDKLETFALTSTDAPPEHLERSCREALQRHGKAIMRLYHEGDCVGLEKWTSDHTTNAGERALVGALLADLGSVHGEHLLASVFPIPQSRTEQNDIAAFLPADEGCAPALCIDGNEPECRPWFGLSAGPGCIPTKYGSLDGCMPGFCREPHELLIQAAVDNWPGTRRTLANLLANSDGYIWGAECHCGVQEIDLSESQWLELAADSRAKQSLLSCLHEHRGDGTETGCGFLVAPVHARKCGQPSARRLAD